MKSKIVVTSACHSNQIARVLGLLIPEKKFIPFVPRLERDDNRVREIFCDCELWLNEEPLVENNNRVFDLIAGVVQREFKIPLIVTSVFHPDDDFTVYDLKGELVKGALGNRHNSAIILASYLSGRPVDRVKELFCVDNFKRLGYLTLWDSEIQRIRGSFTHCSLKFERLYQRLLRYGLFMHDPIHPHAYAIALYAIELAEQLFGVRDIDPAEIVSFLQDDLMPGRVWAFYPELAQNLGLPGGAYRWWFPGGEINGLENFISHSYQYYRKLDLSSSGVKSNRLLDINLSEIVASW